MAVNCDENLECVICHENLVDPRALPCGHSYCGPPRLCLSTIKKSEEVLQCAVCRVEHNLKPEDIKPLYGIRDFFQGSVRKKTTKTVSLPCPAHESNECTIWCDTCCCMICIECFDGAHDDHSMRNLRKHLMKKIGEKFGKGGILQYREDLRELIESKKLEAEKLKVYLVTVQSEVEKIQEQIEVLDEGSEALGREADCKFGNDSLILLRLSELDLLKKRWPQQHDMKVSEFENRRKVQLSLFDYETREEYRFPENQLATALNEILVGVAHYSKEFFNGFGTPFYLLCTSGETFGSIRDRICKFLELNEKDIEEIKFTLVNQSQQTVLSFQLEEKIDIVPSKEMSQKLLPRFMNSAIFLGLDHSKWLGKYPHLEKSVQSLNSTF